MINIANSIAAINIIGKLTDFRTNTIITSIIAIETVFTLLKSWSLISTKSFINGPSPASIAVSSYSFIILFTSSIWLFNSFVAISYFEFIITIWYLSLSNIDVISSGSISFGIFTSFEILE